MGSIPNLSAHQLFQSHLVNCDICRKYDSAEIIETQPDSGVWNVHVKETSKRRLCPVGLVLLEAARKEDPDKNPFKLAFFPFVPKMFQKIEGLVRGNWTICKVVDKSIAAAQPYQQKDKATGEYHWRTSSSRAVGYEVETEDGRRFYCNEKQIRKIKPSKIAATKPSISGSSKASPSSISTLKLFQSGRLVMQQPVKLSNVGSNPTSGAKFKLNLRG